MKNENSVVEGLAMNEGGAEVTASVEAAGQAEARNFNPNHNPKIIMMKKTRSDASWNALSSAQQATLEEWLFEENLSYEDTLARATKELGFAGSVTSLKRFYARKNQERLLSDLAETRREIAEVAKSRVDVGALRESSMKVLAQKLFRQMRDEGIADVGMMAKLLLQNEANEVQRERNEIQKAALDLRKRRFDFERQMRQYDMVDETEEMLPELIDIQKQRYRAIFEKNDPYEYNKKTNAMRKRMFSMDDLPDLLPESAEEEARIEAAKEHDRAEMQRRNLKREAKFRSAMARSNTFEEACLLLEAEAKAEKSAEAARLKAQAEAEAAAGGSAQATEQTADYPKTGMEESAKVRLSPHEPG